MPYEKKSDLPEIMQETMPGRAQEIYIEAYKEAYEQYKEGRGGEAGQEAVAHRDAMHAVKQEYVHDSETGKWYIKGKEPKEETEGKGLLDKIRDTVDDLT